MQSSSLHTGAVLRHCQSRHDEAGRQARSHRAAKQRLWVRARSTSTRVACVTVLVRTRGSLTHRGAQDTVPRRVQKQRRTPEHIYICMPRPQHVLLALRLGCKTRGADKGRACTSASARSCTTIMSRSFVRSPQRPGRPGLRVGGWQKAICSAWTPDMECLYVASSASCSLLTRCVSQTSMHYGRNLRPPRPEKGCSMP
jgi:hypothetical protein